MTPRVGLSPLLVFQDISMSSSLEADRARVRSGAWRTVYSYLLTLMYSNIRRGCATGVGVGVGGRHRERDGVRDRKRSGGGKCFRSEDVLTSARKRGMCEFAARVGEKGLTRSVRGKRKKGSRGWRRRRRRRVVKGACEHGSGDGNSSLVFTISQRTSSWDNVFENTC